MTMGELASFVPFYRATLQRVSIYNYIIIVSVFTSNYLKESTLYLKVLNLGLVSNAGKLSYVKIKAFSVDHLYQLYYHSLLVSFLIMYLYWGFSFPRLASSIIESETNS